MRQRARIAERCNSVPWACQDFLLKLKVLLVHFIENDRMPGRIAAVERNEVGTSPATEAEFVDQIECVGRAVIHGVELGTAKCRWNPQPGSCAHCARAL